MYIDYIRVDPWHGPGEVQLGPPAAPAGAYGIYTDTTPTNGGLVATQTSEIYVWESTLIDGTIPPYEGASGLSWQTNNKGWFGAGIMSIQPLNLSAFCDGHLKFRIKIPAHVTFKIGVIDAWGNQYYVSFPANQTTYGLARDGEWGQAAIPVADIRGTAIDLRMMSYAFVILEENGTPCQFALDDIYWDGGGTTAVDDPGASASGARLLANVPNPFRAGTDLRFVLQRPGPYEIEVYNIAGQRVMGFRGNGQAGANTVRWDGRDGLGRRLGPGVYYYRMLSDERSARGKAVLLK
jgi:hypothetical protein